MKLILICIIIFLLIVICYTLIKSKFEKIIFKRYSEDIYFYFYKDIRVKNWGIYGWIFIEKDCKTMIKNILKSPIQINMKKQLILSINVGLISLYNEQSYGMKKCLLDDWLEFRESLFITIEDLK